MKVNLNISVLDLAGNVLPNTNLGKLVATALAYSNQGDALKFHFWATQFYAGESLELDPSDLITLRDFIKSNQSLTNLVKSQALQIIT